MKKGWFLSILLCYVLAVFLIGCNSNPEPIPVAWRDPFRLNITSEDRYQVSWEGYTDGYVPGDATCRSHGRCGPDPGWGRRRAAPYRCLTNGSGGGSLPII